MTASKFQEHLDVNPPKSVSSTSLVSSSGTRSPAPSPIHSRPSSRRRHTPEVLEARPAAMRFPIDLGPTTPTQSVPTPPRSQSTKKLHRKISSISSFGASHRPDPSSSSTATSSSPSHRNAFAGPDADFDFAGRKQIQRLEPENRVEVDKSAAMSPEKPKLASGVKGRLRKLSLSTR